MAALIPINDIQKKINHFIFDYCTQSWHLYLTLRMLFIGINWSSTVNEANLFCLTFHPCLPGYPPKARRQNAKSP